MVESNARTQIPDPRTQKIGFDDVITDSTDFNLDNTILVKDLALELNLRSQSSFLARRPVPPLLHPIICLR